MVRELVGELRTDNAVEWSETAGRGAWRPLVGKAFPVGDSRENRQNIVFVCGQVRAGALALLYIGLRRLYRRCAHLCNTGVGTFNRPFLKKNARTPETRIIPENAFCSFCLEGDLQLLGWAR